MNHNSVILLLLSHLCCNTSDQCTRLYYKKNVQVQCDGILNVSFTEPKTFEDCMEFCNASACTAVLMETKESTLWCSVFGADHITYKYGSHIIYYKPFVEFHCHEYYQPNGCKECKKSRAGLECDQCNIGTIGDECNKCAVDEHWNGNYPDHLGYAGSIIHLKYTGLRCQYFTGTLVDVFGTSQIYDGIVDRREQNLTFTSRYPTGERYVHSCTFNITTMFGTFSGLDDGQIGSFFATRTDLVSHLIGSK